MDMIMIRSGWMDLVCVTDLTLTYSRKVFAWPGKQTYCGTGTLLVVWPPRVQYDIQNPLIGISGVAVPTVVPSTGTRILIHSSVSNAQTIHGLYYKVEGALW
jgi:hypothetical protein